MSLLFIERAFLSKQHFRQYCHFYEKQSCEFQKTSSFFKLQHLYKNGVLSYSKADFYAIPLRRTRNENVNENEKVMLKIIRTLFIAPLATACVATACTDQENIPEGNALHFNLDIVSDSRTSIKSQVTTSDEIICSVELFLFDSETGILVERLNFSAGNDYQSGAVQKGRSYIVYALANCTANETPAKVSQMGDISIDFGSLSEINAGGVPMAGISGEFTFDDNSSSVTIPIKRLMSKVILNVNTAEMNGKVTVKQVTLHNTPKSIFPFRESNKATPNGVNTGDCASQSDIQRLNSGKSIVLLVGENMQGTLLEGNDDPWNKTPENIPDRKDCCTYVTVEGDYRDGGLSISDVCYNMYLGEDNTSNFDICRNCIYDLTLTLSDEATVLASSWKVERGATLDSREISFDRRTDTLIQNSNSSRRVICAPTSFDYEVFAGEGFGEAGLSFTSNQDGTVTISSNAIEGKSATGRLYVRSWDRARSGYCDFTVMNWDTIVKVNNGQPLLMWKGDTLKFAATVFFENNQTQEIITSKASWNCAGNAGKTIGYPKSDDTLSFVGQKIGTNIITATYLGRSHSVRAVVSTTKAVYMESRDTTIHVGDSVALRGHVIFESGDTLCYTNGFDYLVKHGGILTKNKKNNIVYASRSGKESPMCILKTHDMMLDSTSSVITVLP